MKNYVLNTYHLNRAYRFKGTKVKISNAKQISERDIEATTQRGIKGYTYMYGPGGLWFFLSLVNFSNHGSNFGRGGRGGGGQQIALDVC